MSQRQGSGIKTHEAEGEAANQGELVVSHHKDFINLAILGNSVYKILYKGETCGISQALREAKGLSIGV